MNNPKINEKIAYYYADFCGTIYYVDTVSRVTPTGIVVTNKGLRFNPNGREIKSSKCRRRHHLTSVTIAEEAIAFKKKNHEIRRQIKYLIDTLEVYTNGEVTKEDRDHIIKLAEEITTIEE